MTPDSNFLSPEMYLAKLSRESYFCILRKNYTSFHFLFQKKSSSDSMLTPKIGSEPTHALFEDQKIDFYAKLE